jgi:iron complex outermembrane receptor protein
MKYTHLRKNLLASIIGLSTFAGITLPAVANDSRNNNAPTAASVETVLVTGTRRSDVSHLEASAPIDVLTGDALSGTGAQDLSAALLKLTPSFSLPSTPTGSFASSIPVGAALRGLSADQVLVLINGKRRHTGANFTRQNLNGGRGSASVDLSLIPVSAIARVEVLRDGAVAQYGSDAIAGVINVVLKNRDDGGGIDYRYSEFTRHGGESNQLNAWKGLELPNDGFITVAINAGDKDPANNTDPDPRQFYSNINGQPDPREANARHRNWLFGAPAIRDQYNALINSELPINDQLTAYGFTSYGHRTSIGEGFFEFPRSTSLVNQSTYFKERFPDGRIPITVYKLEDYAATFGTRIGETETGLIDVYVNHGVNIVDSYDHNGLNPSFGPDSASNYFTGGRRNSQTNAALDYTRDVSVSFLASPLTIATGISWRKERYELQAGDPIAHTRGPFFNPSPVAGVGVPAIYSGITNEDERSISRDVTGAFLSLEGSPTEALDLGLAVRYEDYSDFDSTTNVKLSLRYQLTDTLSFRSSVGTGHRAPSIVQLGYSAFSVQTPVINGIPVDVQQRTLLATSEAAGLLGGKALTPEESTNFSAGFVWNPIPNAYITIDAYQIGIDDRIQLSENLSGAAVEQVFAGTPYDNISNAAFFTNILDTRTRGIEASVTYQFDLNRFGLLDVNFGYAKNDTDITEARDIVTANGTVIPSTAIVGRINRASLEEGSPQDKIIFGLGWNLENWKVNFSGRRYGEWAARVAAPSATSQDQTFSPQTIFDLDVAYRFERALPGVKLSAGFQNIFNSYPDHIVGRGASVTKFSFNSPEGSYGRAWYAGVAYDF